jgi:hypothetical protein
MIHDEEKIFEKSTELLSKGKVEEAIDIIDLQSKRGENFAKMVIYFGLIFFCILLTLMTTDLNIAESSIRFNPFYFLGIFISLFFCIWNLRDLNRDTKRIEELMDM